MRPEDPSDQRKSPKISFSRSLLKRAQNAAYAEGYTGERDFSRFISMVVADWIDNRESKRGDGAYPDAPDKDH